MMLLRGRLLLPWAVVVVVVSYCCQIGEGFVKWSLPKHQLYCQRSQLFHREQKQNDGRPQCNGLQQQRIQGAAGGSGTNTHRGVGVKINPLSCSTNLIVENRNSVWKSLSPEITRTLDDEFMVPETPLHEKPNRQSAVTSSSNRNNIGSNGNWFGGNNNNNNMNNRGRFKDGQKGQCQDTTVVEDHQPSVAPQKPPQHGGWSGRRRKKARDIQGSERLEVDLNDTPDIETKDINEQTLDVLRGKGITQFTPVQAQTFMHILTGRDIIAQSRTGTGKTIAFGLPIIELMCRNQFKDGGPQMKRGRGPRFLIICPTRELAQQVSREFSDLGKAHGIAVEVFYGGSSYATQEAAMRRGLDVLVATPGRLLDHLSRGKLDISQVAHVVLDEADEMLNMGFADDIENVFQYVHLPTCQVLLFSATIPPWVSHMSSKYLKNPLHVDAVGTETSRLATTVKHVAIETSEAHRSHVLEDIIAVYGKGSAAIVFVPTKRECDELASGGAFKSLTVQVLHGDIGQKQRDVTISQFRQGKFQVLVATDVAARGIDISNIGLVIQYNLPNGADIYVHRSGRTGRAGRPGTAVSLYSNREEQRLARIEREVGKNFKFQRASVPTYSAVTRVAGLVALKNLQAVDNDVVPHFRHTAKELLDETIGNVCQGEDERERTEVLISKCLAAISRKTTLQVRSMLTGEIDMATLIMSTERLISQGDLIYAVKKLANSAGVKCKVGKVVLVNTEMAAAFDVPKEVADVLIKFSREQNLQKILFSIPDELPKLQRTSSTSFSRLNGSKGDSKGWHIDGGASTSRYRNGYRAHSRYRDGKGGGQSSYSDGGKRYKQRKYSNRERPNSRQRNSIGLQRERNVPW